MIADDLNTCGSQTWKSNVCKATGLKHKFNIAAHLKKTQTPPNGASKITKLTLTVL